MKYLIKINRDSIKKNSNAGQMKWPMYGQTYESIDDQGNLVQTREVQYMYTMTPVPKYFFEYMPFEVQCKYCYSKFPYTELDDDYYMDNDEETCISEICPNCNKSNCCEIEFEEFEESFVL